MAEYFYRDVLDYYNGELFDKKNIPVLDIACLYPACTDGGAYKRKDLIVSITLGENESEAGRMISHEMAHLWCTGAACDSWEDWLNETTATWGSLLYALKRNNTELFDFILKQSLESYESYESLPPIKTADGSRPEGVHEKGTVLFYVIYKHYGAETIEKLLRIFVKLSEKTTKAFLDAVKVELSTEVAAMLESGISESVYGVY